MRATKQEAIFKPALIATLLSAFAVAGWAQEKSWQREWDVVVAAARKEGTVTVAGAPDPVMRNEIIPKFTSRFGIPVEFLAGRTSQVIARLRTERLAGVYTVDLVMSGISPAIDLYNEKMLDPLKPILFLPEVIDPSKWKNGKLWFVDPEARYVLRPFNSVASHLHINTEHVRPQDLRAAKDLLNPKWKGKISTEDPADSGSGQNQAVRFYLQLGGEFIKRLYIDQRPGITRERRQLADWLARGTYPICLACREDDVMALRREEFKISEIFELSDIAGTVGSSPWLLTAINRAPHPNAARLFANWIVSREGLEIYSRGHRAVTLRKDVDESFLRPESIPRAGVDYFDTSDWQWRVTGRAETEERVRRLLKSR
jgi:iron(III) transport system substrate-binding protein